MLKSRLSVKISLLLAVIAVPLMALATWLAVLEARDTVSELLLDQGRVAALSGAQAYSSILEATVNAGVLTLDDVIEPPYEEISFPGLAYCPPAALGHDAVVRVEQDRLSSNRDPILPHVPTRIVGRPEEGPLMLERLFISSASCGEHDWIINDVEVDGVSQLEVKNLSGAARVVVAAVRQRREAAAGDLHIQIIRALQAHDGLTSDRTPPSPWATEAGSSSEATGWSEP
jgi:hypothetical protein